MPVGEAPSAAALSRCALAFGAYLFVLARAGASGARRPTAGGGGRASTVHDGDGHRRHGVDVAKRARQASAAGEGARVRSGRRPSAFWGTWRTCTRSAGSTLIIATAHSLTSRTERPRGRCGAHGADARAELEAKVEARRISNTASTTPPARQRGSLLSPFALETTGGHGASWYRDGVLLLAQATARRPADVLVGSSKLPLLKATSTLLVCAPPAHE